MVQEQFSPEPFPLTLENRKEQQHTQEDLEEQLRDQRYQLEEKAILERKWDESARIQFFEIQEKIRSLHEEDAKRTLAQLKHCLRKGALSETVVLRLAGLGDDDAFGLRNYLEEKNIVNHETLALSLVGIGTPRSIELRKKYIEEFRQKEERELQKFAFDSIVRGLTGAESELSIQQREELKRVGADADFLAESMSGVDTKAAEEFLAYLMKDKNIDKNFIVLGLTGHKRREAMASRRSMLEGGININYLAESFAGVRTPEAMGWRKYLLQQGASFQSLLLGLIGVEGVEEMEFRRYLKKRGASNENLLFSLAGVRTAESMKWREMLMKEGADKNYLVWSLAGVVTEEAEELRKKYFGDDADLLARSYATGIPRLDAIVCRYGYET